MDIKIKRNAREIKLELESPNFKGSYGTTNKSEPSVIFIKLFSWLKHDDDIYNYPENVENLKKKIKQKFREHISETDLFSPKTFYNFDTKGVLVKSDESFHGSFEFTIKQNEPIIENLDNIKLVIENICNKLIQSMENSSIFGFQFAKK